MKLYRTLYNSPFLHLFLKNSCNSNFIYKQGIKNILNKTININ
mgnify:FL=1